MHRLLRRTLFAGSAALAGAVLWGAQSASADDGTDDQVQEAVVDNATTQEASAAVGSGQVNVSAPVAVGGGGGGDVTQSNSADNEAAAGNANATIQDVAQGQGASSTALDGSADGGGQVQGADVVNATEQWADAAVHNGQANLSAPTSVGSEGGGDVTQSNDATNTAAAGNENLTAQFVAQGQAASTIGIEGSAYGGDQDQAAIVDNLTLQSAEAGVLNGQANISAPASVGSEGGGDVTQSNDAMNAAAAGNSNATIQDVLQGQGSSTIGIEGSAYGGDQDQAAIVVNTTLQSAHAGVLNGQANISAPASVGSEGGGDVTQSNSASNDAVAFNENLTAQIVTQGQGASTIGLGGNASGGGQSQFAWLDNFTFQSAEAGVLNGQANIAAPTSVASGGGGDTTQSNDASNSAAAGNSNATIQDVLQAQGASTTAVGGAAWGGGQDQAAIVVNTTLQSAHAGVLNGQLNVSAPTSVGSEGGGDVTQSNSASNDAAAFNENMTAQIVTQLQGASGSGGGQSQVAIVDNLTLQSAAAGVLNGQANVAAPTSVGSEGGGDVTQSNDASNAAVAGNSNATIQDVLQGQASNGGGSAPAAAAGDDNGNGNGNSDHGQNQVADVANWTAQDAWAGIDNGQHNVYAPVSVGGGGGGDVTQSNDATNAAGAGNENGTAQVVEQGQAGSGSGDGYGQDQSAYVDNATGQSASSGVSNGQYNVYAPVSVFSTGAASGSVNQSNSATNDAAAVNSNGTLQGVAQGQGGSGSGSGQGQSAGVSNSTDQSVDAYVSNGQYNVYAPVSVFSPGAASGSVSQSNSATNAALAANLNETEQVVEQGQAGNGSGDGSGQDQWAGVSNETSQWASANVSNGQYNVYAPVSVFSIGAAGGSVSQSNTANNSALAGNANATFQGVAQGQAAGGSGSGSGQRQSAALHNATWQAAYAPVRNAQANVAAPVSVGSLGAGGAVTQSNTATNTAAALNLNETFQSVLQGAGISRF